MSNFDLNDSLYLDNDAYNEAKNNMRMSAQELTFNTSIFDTENECVGTESMVELTNRWHKVADTTKGFRDLYVGHIDPLMCKTANSINSTTENVACSLGESNQLKSESIMAALNSSDLLRTEQFDVLKHNNEMYSGLKDEYGFSDDEMNYLISNYPSLLKELDGIRKYSSSDAREIYKKIEKLIVEYHVSALKKDGVLNMEEICKYMLKDPLDISKGEYLALCKLYDSMKSSQKEQFILSAYSCQEIYTDRYTTGGGAGYYQYVRSYTFDVFQRIYKKNLAITVGDFSVMPYDGESIADVKKRIQKSRELMDGYNILYAISNLTEREIVGGSFDTNSSNTHNDGNTLEFHIYDDITNESDKFKIVLKTTKSNNVTTIIQNKVDVYNSEFTIYRYDSNLGDSFSDALNNSAEGLKININHLIENSVAQFVIDEAVKEIPIGDKPLDQVPFVREGLTIYFLIRDINNEVNAAEQTNKAAELIQYESTIAGYLSKINCSGTLIIDENGVADISAYNYDKERIKEMVESYNALYPNKQITYNEDTFISDIVNDKDYRESLNPESDITSFFDYLDQQNNGNAGEELIGG